MSQGVPQLVIVSISVVELVLQLPHSVEGGILGSVCTAMHVAILVRLLLLEMIWQDGLAGQSVRVRVALHLKVLRLIRGLCEREVYIATPTHG